MKIRQYKHNDYAMLQEWFLTHGKETPPQNMFSEQTTFIIEDKEPIACITVYLTNVKALSLLEHFVSNPKIEKIERNKATKILVDYCYSFLKNLGYRHVLGFAESEKLQERYINLGMFTVNKNLIGMVRTL